MPSVLFVCTANRFRSPLAAALFRKTIHEHGVTDNWIVNSAGTWAQSGLAVIPAVSVIAYKYGVDLSRHRSVDVNEEMLSACDLILVMEAGHKEALENEFPAISQHIHLLAQVAEGRTYDIPDLNESFESVMEVCGNLYDLIQSGFDNICSLAIRLQNTSKETNHR